MTEITESGLQQRAKRDLMVAPSMRVNDERRLFETLFKDYDTKARPVYNAADVVHVKFGLTLAQLADMVRRVRQCCDSLLILFNFLLEHAHACVISVGYVT